MKFIVEQASHYFSTEIDDRYVKLFDTHEETGPLEETLQVAEVKDLKQLMALLDSCGNDFVISTEFSGPEKYPSILIYDDYIE